MKLGSVTQSSDHQSQSHHSLRSVQELRTCWVNSHPVGTQREWWDRWRPRWWQVSADGGVGALLSLSYDSSVPITWLSFHLVDFSLDFPITWLSYHLLPVQSFDCPIKCIACSLDCRSTTTCMSNHIIRSCDWLSYHWIVISPDCQMIVLQFNCPNTWL